MIHTDYEGVVKRLWGRPRTAARFSRLWELVDSRIYDIGWGSDGVIIEWVESHRAVGGLPYGPFEHYLAMGNGKAGEPAQRAAALNGPNDAWLKAAATLKTDVRQWATEVSILACGERRDVEDRHSQDALRKADHERALKKAGKARHYLALLPPMCAGEGKRWRCELCGCSAKAVDGKPAKLDKRWCPGVPAAAAAANLTHRVAILDDWAFCEVRGKFGWSKPRSWRSHAEGGTCQKPHA